MATTLLSGLIATYNQAYFADAWSHLLKLLKWWIFSDTGFKWCKIGEGIQTDRVKGCYLLIQVTNHRLRVWWSSRKEPSQVCGPGHDSRPPGAKTSHMTVSSLQMPLAESCYRERERREGLTRVRQKKPVLPSVQLTTKDKATFSSKLTFMP